MATRMMEMVGSTLLRVIVPNGMGILLAGNPGLSAKPCNFPPNQFHRLEVRNFA